MNNRREEEYEKDTKHQQDSTVKLYIYSVEVQ